MKSKQAAYEGWVNTAYLLRALAIEINNNERDPLYHGVAWKDLNENAKLERLIHACLAADIGSTLNILARLRELELEEVVFANPPVHRRDGEEDTDAADTQAAVS